MSVYIKRTLFFCAVCIASLAFAHPGQHDQLARASQAIEHNPDQQGLYIRRGVIYATGGQYQQALADYRQAERLGDPIVVAHELGVLYYKMGDFERARQYLDSYLQQFPNSAASYEARARVARDRGDYPRAMADLNQYFKLHDSPHPGNYLSAAAMLQEMGQTEAALSLLDQGIAKLGLTPQLQREAVRLEIERQQPVAAIVRLQTLRQPLRESPGWKLEMAELLILAERREEAASILREAEAELSIRRSTPANLALLQQVRELEEALNTPTSP